MKRQLIALSLISLSACASMTQGTSQRITVNTMPQGAHCSLSRVGQSLGSITTPGSLLVDRANADITINCAKAGYRSATYKDVSGVSETSHGNAFAGGLIGIAIDNATGARNEYQSPVNLSLGKE